MYTTTDRDMQGEHEVVVPEVVNDVAVLVVAVSVVLLTSGVHISSTREALAAEEIHIDPPSR